MVEVNKQGEVVSFNKHDLNLARAFEATTNPQKMLDFKLELLVLNCLTHMLDNELQNLSSVTELLIDKESQRMWRVVQKDMDKLLNRLCRHQTSQDYDAYGSLVNYSSLLIDIFRRVICFGGEPWQWEEIRKVCMNVVSDECIDRKTKEVYDQLSEKCAEARQTIGDKQMKASLMLLEHVKINGLKNMRNK